MKQLFINILIILSVVVTQGIGQSQYAQVRTELDFDNLDIQFNIELNGINLNQDKSEYTIPINTTGFDTIKYKLNGSELDWAIMKLRPNTEYQINSNSCSLYTLRPTQEPKQGMVQFIIKSQDTTSYYVGVDGFDRRVNRNSIDEFYYSPPSAMCPYSAKSIEIQTLDRDNLRTVNFHFLHGELVGVKFNKDDNTIELDLFGYVRDENDYRYYYDKNE